jgi:hypothetical protein
MKIFLLRVSILIVGWIIVFSISSLFDPPTINMQNCNPEGLISRLKRAYDPLGFAVKQLTALEDYYSQKGLEDAIDFCKHAHQGNAKEKSICEHEAFLHEKTIRKCYIFWTKQCNINGGSCNYLVPQSTLNHDNQ